jgi:hypothetical protein
MNSFQRPFFKSDSDKVESIYSSGVLALQRRDYRSATRDFEAAAEGGHVSAKYNLALIHGAGLLSPYSIDAAADYWYKAAREAHPSAMGTLYLIEAADRGGLGYDNLVELARDNSFEGGLNAFIMITACRFTDVICKQFGATADYIAYEVDAANASDLAAVRSFVARTGIDEGFSRGGLDRLIPGSAADQITDGLNKLSVAMRRNGLSEVLSAMARCTVVGYVISKSPYGASAQPLLGQTDFCRV